MGVIAGTLVATRTGFKPIECVQVADQVLTHNHRYRPVVSKHRTMQADGFRVKGGGHRGLVMCGSHRMWARRNRTPHLTRSLTAPEGVTAEHPELPHRYYYGSPRLVPAQPLPPLPMDDAKALITLAGCWVADGYLHRRGADLRGFGLTDHDDDIPRLRAMLQRLGMRPSVQRRKTNATGLFVTHHAVARFLHDHFGEYSSGKRLPAWLWGAPESWRGAFLDGYLAGDGHWDANRRRWTASSASKELICGLRLLVQSMGHSATYTWVDPKVSHIAGTALKQAPQRSHRLIFSQHGHGLVESGFVWQKVSDVQPQSPVEAVYDLEVADDHSYLADGLISRDSREVVAC